MKEILNTYLSKPDAEKEAEEMQKIIRERRKIIEPVKTMPHDFQEAYEKMERDKAGNKKEIALEKKEIKELFDVVLFDWDGVLYDSMENIAKGAVEICREFGVEIDVKKFMETYDQPYQEWYKRVGIPADNESAHQYIRCLFHEEILPKLKTGKQDDLFPDVISTLEELKKRGLKVGVVSSHIKEDIERIINEKGISNFIDYVVGRADNKSEAIRNICVQNGFLPEKVLMIGDLPSDLRDAKKAGIKAAAVVRFSGNKDKLGSYDPDYLFDHLGEEVFKIKPYVDKK